MTTPKIILYGAEAKPRPTLSLGEQLRFSARRKLHSYRDATHFRHGDLSHLDYRNYEGQDTINLGDVAIYQSTAALIKRVLPEADILPMNWGELSQYSVKNEGRHKTMLIFNGSGYFHVDADGRLDKRIKDDLDTLRHHAIPAFFFGVGLNRPGQADLDAPVSLHPDDAALVTQLLDYAQAVSVRDAATQSALAALTTKPVHLIGDPALHFFHAMGMQTLAAKTHPANTPPVIGVNFSFHGKDPNALLKKNLEGYCAVLLRLQKETGAEFRYFVHYATENILPQLLAQRGVNIKKASAKVGAGDTPRSLESVSGKSTFRTADTAALAREYAKLDLHIGGMLYARAMDLLANPAPVCTQIAIRRDQLEMETHAFLKTCFAA